MTSLAERSLKAKITRFFRGDRGEIELVKNFIDELSQHGPSYIFGGMLRDLVREPISNFQSDIDIVVDFELDLIEVSALGTRNKFGGYRLIVGGWNIDLWEIKNTWAFKRNYIQYENVESLLLTTITNWDAILYSWNEKKIICSRDYFSDLHEGVLDIVMENTPNPINMCVRVLRYIIKKDAKVLTHKSVDYLCRSLNKYNLDVLRSAEKRSFSETTIGLTVRDRLKRELCKASTIKKEFFSVGDILEKEKSRQLDMF